LSALKRQIVGLALILINQVCIAQSSPVYIPKEYSDQNHAKVPPHLTDTIVSAFKIMNEPSLWETPQEIQCFRFSWFRTFHEPISIRIEHARNGYLVHSTVLDGEGGFDIGKIKLTKSKPITPAQWSRLLSLAKAASYWELSTDGSTALKGGYIDVSSDGADWILEGTAGHKYHLVYRHSPGPSKFKSLCLYMLQISGLKVNPNEIY